MKTLKKLSLVITAGIACFSAQAMEHQRITKENLLSMVPVLDAGQQEIVTEWKQQNAGLVAGLNALTSFNDWAKTMEMNNALLRDYGLENKSTTGNYSVVIPKTQLIARFAGQINKRQNIIQAQGAMSKSNTKQSCIGALDAQNPLRAKKVAKIRKFHNKQFEQYYANPVETYQGISRAAHGKLVADAQERLQLDKIKVVKSHLVAYKGQENAIIPTDETHFVVEEFTPDFKAIKGDSLEFKELSPEAFVQLIQAVQAGYLWNEHDNLAIREDGKTIVITDFEQPNCANPLTFFMEPQTLEYFESVTCDAIKSLLNMATPEQKAAAKSYILSNAELQKFNQYQNKVEPIINS